MICTASVNEQVPRWMRAGAAAGSPPSTRCCPPRPASARSAISKGKPDGRAVEIQRLIGRSLRVVVDFEALGERSVYVDCDVLQADGGTRCASITGGYVALRLALAEAARRERSSDAADRLGRGGQRRRRRRRALCDLDYSEDSRAEVDANVVMTGDGGLVEVQATAERTPLSRASLDELLALAEGGIARLRQAQERVAGAASRLDRRHPQRAQAAGAAEILPGVELVPLPDGGRAAARGRRHLRRERADQGPRRPRGDRRGGDRRRLGDRGRGARRRARASARPATPARTRPTRRTWRSCCARSPPPATTAASPTSARSPSSTPTAPSASSRAAARDADSRAARRGRLRLRPGVRPRRHRPRRRADDGRAERRPRSTRSATAAAPRGCSPAHLGAGGADGGAMIRTKSRRRRRSRSPPTRC